MNTITYSKVINLSHPIHFGIPLWSGDPPVEIEAVAQIERDGYFLRRFSMGEHSATHMNAPNSFFPGAVGIDAYSADALVVPACVINVQTQAAGNPDYGFNRNDLAQWEQAYGVLAPKSVVLLNTGWHTKWADPATFLNLDATGVPHFPGFSAEVTDFLVAERAIAGVGIDTHGVDGGLDQTYATNRRILAERGIVLECLANLHQLPPVGTILVIAPLPLQEGSGAPASVFAFVP